MFSFLLPSKKAIKETKATIAKKTDAVTADVKDAVGAVVEKAAPLAEKKVEEVKEGVKTRAGKGKAAQ